MEKMAKTKALNMAKKMMAKEQKGGFGYHSSAKHMSVNMHPKYKHNYSVGEKEYIKAKGGIK